MILATMYVNAQQQLILVVEHRTHVLVAFANVELWTRVVTRVKLVVQELVCAELLQHVLERRQDLTVMPATMFVNVQRQ